MLHLVSALAADYGLMLGQVKTQSHSNEITAIPGLREQMQLSNSTATIDAMGCHKEIANWLRRMGKVIQVSRRSRK